MQDLPLIDEQDVDVDAPPSDVWAALTANDRFGFSVARADPPRELALVGRHPFARYALTWRIDDLGDRSRLWAESRAVFPGVHGFVYRTLVIGTGFHVLAVRRMLDGVRRAAEARR